MTSTPMSKNAPFLFIATGLLSLLLGSILGCVGAFQFVFPELFQTDLPFHKTRPLHVSLAISWILFCSIGGVYYYLSTSDTTRLWSSKLALAHYYIFFFTGLGILSCYAAGQFGGREYFEFPPVLLAPVIFGWALFAINIFASLTLSRKPLPIYLWMWGTSAGFVIFILLEAHAWLLPHFGTHMVRDITVQWKSYGSMIGCWNMLVYGTAICLMYRIKEDDDLLYSKKCFVLYFLGLTNMMFNWGHHTYVVPSAPWIKHIAYAISMTELIILWLLIKNWLNCLRTEEKESNIYSYRFLFAADAWVLLNLVLAIAISVPAINLFTHGTHITVAHAMGATIGINTMILLASVLFIASREQQGGALEQSKSIRLGFYAINLSLMVFLGALLLAGIRRSYSTHGPSTEAFSAMIEAIHPYMFTLGAAGLGILIGFFLVIIPTLGALFSLQRAAGESTLPPG